MDRKLDKKEIQKKKYKNLLKISSISLGIILCSFIIIPYFKASLIEKDLYFSSVKEGNIDLSVPSTGIVKPLYEEVLTAPISARILKIYAKSGDQLNKGDKIMQLDVQHISHDYKNMQDKEEMLKTKLEQLKVNNQTHISELKMKILVSKKKLNRMKVELDNAIFLDSLGSGTKDNLNKARLNVEVAQLELEQQQQQVINEKRVAQAEEQVQKLEYDIHVKNLQEEKRTLEKATIRAPQKTVVTYINNEIGSMIKEGEKVISIADLSHYKIQAEISDAYSDKIKIGAKVIVANGVNKHIGYINRIQPLTQNGQIQFEIRLEEDNHPNLRSGLKTKCHVQYAAKTNVPIIKVGSYYNGPGKYKLFVKKENLLIKKEVDLGYSNYEYVEILSGLQIGEEVCTNDLSNHSNKTKIKLK